MRSRSCKRSRAATSVFRRARAALCATSTTTAAAERRLEVGWVILDAGDAQAKGVLERSHRFLRTNFEPGRQFANALDFQPQLDGWSDRANQRVHRTIRAVP